MEEENSASQRKKRSAMTAGCSLWAPIEFLRGHTKDAKKNAEPASAPALTPSIESPDFAPPAKIIAKR